jgi:hypothetical protein
VGEIFEANTKKVDLRPREYLHKYLFVNEVHYCVVDECLREDGPDDGVQKGL